MPLAIAFFGDHHRIPDPVDEVVAFEDASEWSKAMIAGFHGHTGAEYLDFGLQKAAGALGSRRERLRVIIVVHDGQPVARWVKAGREVSDWDESLARVHALERRGIPVIGLYLGDPGKDTDRMRDLFPRLAACRAEELPDKLGNLLRSLA